MARVRSDRSFREQARNDLQVRVISIARLHFYVLIASKKVWYRTSTDRATQWFRSSEGRNPSAAFQSEEVYLAR
jgi:hypothetical protein